jgi:flagellar assembly protein FliH
MAMDAAFHIKPFAFDRVFTAPPSRRPERAPLDLELETESLREELDTLRRDHAAELARARSDGFEAGLFQARTERETALLAAADALHASLEIIEADLSEVTSRITREATEVALAAADFLAARALEHAPEQAIDEALGRIIEQAGRGPQLLVKVHPDLAPEMERIVEVRLSRERRRMTLNVVADPALARGDAQILWEEGGLALDAGARRAAVLEELAPLLGD